jgi:MSHA biogenesis protein MshJ
MTLLDGLPGGLRPLWQRVVPAMERYNQMSLRERALIFGATLVLTFMAWQLLLMDPLAARAAAAGQKLAESQQRAAASDAAGEAATASPAVTAIARERALRERSAKLQQDLAEASRDYVPPERMMDVLRQLLLAQHGLRLISLRNLPAESLASARKPGKAGDGKDAVDHGPYLHPVEIEFEGDYASVVAYVHALDGLAMRVRWRELAVTAKSYPLNRVRIEIATFSLSRDWMTV